MEKRIALISGATSGIGEATAKVLASAGIDLVLCGRRKERLDTLKETLSKQVKVTTLVFDVREMDQVKNAIESLPTEFKKIDILINNAGNAFGLDFIQNGNVNDWDLMIDTNIKGLLYVSKVVIPKMIDNKQGHIINISSIAGKETYPKGNVYCASKAAVEALSAGMRLDLNPYGIKVTNIAPGAVNTEFSKVRFNGDEQKADKVYEGFQPLQAQDIAEVIGFVVSRPAHVMLGDIVVLPTAQASATTINRSL